MISGLPDDLLITPDMAAQLRIDEITASASKPLIYEYVQKWALARDEMLSQSRDPEAQALHLLVTLGTFGLSDDPKQPFTPMMSGDNWRSALPEDLTEPQSRAVEILLDATKDPEVRARIADVLWNRKQRNPEHGRAAIEAYLASADRLFDPSHWTWPMDRLRRANSIAILFGRESIEFNRVTQEFRETLRRLRGNDGLYFTERVMAVLADRELPSEELEDLRQCSMQMAEDAARQGDHRRSRAYFACALTWNRALEDQEEFARVRLLIAESYVDEALMQPAQSSRAPLLRRAVRELRDARAVPDRINEVRVMLDDSQELMLGELTTLAFPFDPSELAAAARSEARGVTATEGFWKLAFLVPIPKKSDLRTRALESIEKYVFAHGFGRQHIGLGGRFTGRTPGSIGGDGDDREQLILTVMREDADRGRLLAVHGLIEPMRRELNNQFAYTLQDVYMTLRGRILIPYDREMLWVQGVHAGLVGDYSTAIHVLIPQLDHALRRLLQMKNVLPYKQNASGVQDVFKLEDTLGHEKLAEALGEDLVFQLEALLVDRTSANLRNLLTHGLINYAQASSYDSAYCWWLCLHLLARVGTPPSMPIPPSQTTDAENDP